MCVGPNYHITLALHENNKTGSERSKKCSSDDNKTEQREYGLKR